MKKMYAVEYVTDTGLKVNIKLNYFTNNADKRIEDGGLEVLVNECNFALGRRFIKPRYVMYKYKENGKDIVQKVICKTHAKMLDLVDKDPNVISYCGECLSNCGLGFLKK